MTQVHSPLLSLAEAREEACLACTGSPCCRYVNLKTFDLSTVSDIDQALYALNFEGVFISLVRDMQTAQVFFHQDCRHLDPQGLCSIHSTPAQPSICIQYQSHDCAYRQAFGELVNDEQPVVDRDQMRWFVEQLTFDEDRRVVGRPFWPDVVEGFRRLAKPRSPLRAEPTSGLLQIRPSRTAADLESAGPHRFSDPGVGQPCDSCPAYCCHNLVFPRRPPANARELDFLRYALGFPSIELKLSDDEWAVVVKTSCRHNVDGRCAVYGSDERPIRCSDYDEFHCDYKTHFGDAGSSESLHIGPNEFPFLADLIVFDDMGRVRYVPPVGAVAQALHGTQAREEPR